MEIEILIRNREVNLNILERMKITEFKSMLSSDPNLLLSMIDGMVDKVSEASSQEIDGADNIMFIPFAGD